MSKRNGLPERVKKTRVAAHKRVLKDSTVQFRLDAENMERLLKLADKKKTGVGVLARMWVLEQLNKESNANFEATSSHIAPLTSAEIQLMRSISRGFIASIGRLARS